MSFNLEGYMWDKQKGKENNKERVGARQDTSNLHTDNAHHINGGGQHLNERQEVGHMSMISEDKLKQKGDQFVREYMPDKMKKFKTRKIQVHIDLSSQSSLKLKDCVVCMSDTADGVIMPCGHGGICY